MASIKQAVNERRRHPRYKVVDVSVVVGDRRLGQILDMSLGGLSFSYVSVGRQEEKDEVDLGIVFGPNGHYLDKLPTRFVSESILSKGAPANGIVVRRRSMQFVALSDEQREKLYRFIKNHTIGKAA